MGIVLMLHSLWRWVVVVVALVALVKFGLGWLQKKTPDAFDRRLVMAFTTTIDIQVLLGIVLVVLMAMGSSVPMSAIEHIVTMVIAAVVAHLTGMWRKREDNAVLRNNFFVVLVTMVLIAAGVSVVNGWHF